MASEIKVDTVSEKTSGSGVTIDGLLIKDGGISGDVSLIGTTPTFTIGDAGAEDATLLFDGNAQDFHIGLDDTADDLVIGVGSTLGTTTAIAIDENTNTTFSGTVTVGVDDTGKDVKFFGASAGAYMEWDESADQLRIMGASADATTSTGKLLLATSLTDINANDVIGKIEFQAPHEAGGTDAITVAASIQAMAQGTFSSSVNATDLIFYTGHSEAAAEKIRITSQNEIGIAGANYGTDGQVLTSGGAGAAVAWEDAGGAITALNNATANELVTVGSTTTELDAETNLIYNGTILGCGADGANADLGDGIHIKQSDSSASVHSNADQVVIERNDACGLSILSATNNSGNIMFGDSGDNDIGSFIYMHNDNSLTTTVNAAIATKIDSSGAVTKPLQPSARVHLAANQTGIGNATFTKVTFDTEDFDINGDFASNKFTAPVDGRYYVMAHLQMIDLGDTKDLLAAIYKNGSIWFQSDEKSASSNQQSIEINDVMNLSATDYIEIYVKHAHGSNRNLKGDASSVPESGCYAAFYLLG